MKAPSGEWSSELVRTFNGRLFRIILGALVGMPLTVAALMAVPDGLALAIGGVQQRSVFTCLLGPAIVLGLVGIAGGGAD
jgi:hypothetical protein